MAGFQVIISGLLWVIGNTGDIDDPAKESLYHARQIVLLRPSAL